MIQAGEKNPRSTGVHPGTVTQGLPFKVVHVISITDDVALVRDSLGRDQQVSITNMRAKGSYPVEGEWWTIDRIFGPWTFSSIVIAVPPVITGDTDGNPALISLLNALAAAGLIVDATDHVTRIRATHDHTHVAPAGGGVTSTETPS